MSTALRSDQPSQSTRQLDVSTLNLKLSSELRGHRKLDIDDLGSGLLTVVSQSNTPIVGEELKRIWRSDKRAAYVGTADFNFSSHFVYSESFSRCQGLVLWDPLTNIGAIGHFNPQTDPYYLLEGHTYGPFGDFNKHVPIASEVFEHPHRVRLAHIFGDAYSYPEIWVESALKRKGFTQSPVHLKVNSSWRDIGLDAKSGNIFVVRSDRIYPSGFRLFGPLTA